MMKNTPFTVRLWLYPFAYFLSFVLVVLLGCFITAEMNPMQWTPGSRSGVVTIWAGFLSWLIPIVLELSETPKTIADLLEGE
jgi:hypothetical protein